MYQLNNQYMEMELRYFSIYKDSQTELRKYRHDMKNHLLCLHTLCEEENYPEIKKFVQNLTDGWKDLNPFYHIGNDIADAIVNGKYYIAKEYGIAFDVSGSFHSGLALSPLEICTIFSNALDNAIEGNLRIEDRSKRYINVEIKQTDNFFVISFENPLSTPVEVRSNSLIASTKTTGDHGFGLLNIKNTAEKADLGGDAHRILQFSEQHVRQEEIDVLGRRHAGVHALRTAARRIGECFPPGQVRLFTNVCFDDFTVQKSFQFSQKDSSFPHSIQQKSDDFVQIRNATILISLFLRIAKFM